MSMSDMLLGYCFFMLVVIASHLSKIKKIMVAQQLQEKKKEIYDKLKK